MPDGQMSFAEYERALDALLLTVYKELGWGDKDLANLKQQALDRYALEGWHEGLPFVGEIMAKGRGPRWQSEQYQKDVQAWQKEVKGLTEQDWANKFAYEQLRLGQEWKTREYETAWQEAGERRRKEAMDIWQANVERGERRWLAEQNLKAQQYGGAAERFAAMTRNEPQPDWAGMSKTYEGWRRRLLGELQSPEDWITRWQVQNQQNPYQRPETTPAEEATRVGEEVKKWDALIKTQKDIIKRASQDPEVAVSQADLQLLKWAEQAKDVAEHSLVEWERKDIELGRSYPTGSPIVTSTYQPGGEGGITEVGWGANEPARPTTPPTPSWLRSMYPQLGERLPERGKAQPLAPLSGQAWTALTPSQQAGWGGYARYAGASPEDLMALTQRMLPRTPYVSGRWAPASQRA